MIAFGILSETRERQPAISETRDRTDIPPERDMDLINNGNRDRHEQPLIGILQSFFTSPQK